MNLLKKITLTCLGLAFFAGLYVTVSEAQGRSRWYGNNGRHYGWTNGRHRGWDNGRKRGWDRNDRYGYNSWGERRRQRYGFYNTRNRYYRDGYLSYWERQRLANRYARYRRSAYRSYRY